jgi:hypothetical protein
MYLVKVLSRKVRFQGQAVSIQTIES